MRPFRDLFDMLVPPSPMQEVADTILGTLTWDSWTKSWVSQPVAPRGAYTFQIGRFKRSVTPPDDCVAVARRIAQDPESLERIFQCLKSQEAERRREPLRPLIMSLGITSITLRSEEGQVRGEMALRSDPPQFGWACWHVDGVPAGIYQQTD